MIIMNPGGKRVRASERGPEPVREGEGESDAERSKKRGSFSSRNSPPKRNPASAQRDGEVSRGRQVMMVPVGSRTMQGPERSDCAKSSKGQDGEAYYRYR